MIDDELLDSFVTRFVSRRDDYAVQQISGRYLRKGRPLTQRTLRDHLEGCQSVGTYVIDERGMCRYAVFDADRHDGIETLLEVQAALAEEDGVPSYLERSRRGGHLWVFLDALYRASVVRRWLLPVCPAGVEFYPKQDEGSGFGSLMRLPLGVHLLSGRRYPFVELAPGGLVEVASTIPDILQWLAMCERAAVPTPALVAATTGATATVATPIVSNNPGMPSTPAPTMTIHQWCAAQNPFALIGRYVELDNRGMGCCPFGWHHDDGRDSHPSFRVYAPTSATGACWYCYTNQDGGNVFDFLSLYHGLDARTLWHRILCGEVW